jgi:hypothetical protein
MPSMLEELFDGGSPGQLRRKKAEWLRPRLSCLRSATPPLRDDDDRFDRSARASCERSQPLDGNEKGQSGIGLICCAARLTYGLKLGAEWQSRAHPVSLKPRHVSVDWEHNTSRSSLRPCFSVSSPSSRRNIVIASMSLSLVVCPRVLESNRSNCHTCMD